MINTVVEIVKLRSEFEVSLMDATHKAPMSLLSEARELMEISDSRHTVVVPDHVEALSVDGGVWLPVMLYIEIGTGDSERQEKYDNEEA